jgi:hypothetical protein
MNTEYNIGERATIMAIGKFVLTLIVETLFKNYAPMLLLGTTPFIKTLCYNTASTGMESRPPTSS